MRFKKPGCRDLLIFLGSLILFYLVFQFWDQLKALIAGILHL